MELDSLFKEEPAKVEEVEESEDDDPALPQESEEAKLLEAALAGKDDGGVETSTQGGEYCPIQSMGADPLGLRQGGPEG